MDRYIETPNPTLENVKKIIDELVEQGHGRKIVTVFDFGTQEPIEGLYVSDEGRIEIAIEMEIISEIIGMECQ